MAAGWWLPLVMGWAALNVSSTLQFCLLIIELTSLSWQPWQYLGTCFGTNFPDISSNLWCGCWLGGVHIYLEEEAL